MKKLKILVVAIVALFSNLSFAQVEPVDKNKLALGGYDVVAYFTPQKATKGSEKFAVKHNGANYYFSSAKNQAAFKANPTKYLPQCDGYCAFGVAEKKQNFPINPTTFKIVGGKLYLFFNGDFNGSPFNSLTEWNKNEKQQLKNLASVSSKKM